MQIIRGNVFTLHVLCDFETFESTEWNIPHYNLISSVCLLYIHCLTHYLVPANFISKYV